MRILFVCGYNHPSHHRKVELLADSEEVDILQIVGPDCDRESGAYPSADGRRSYRLRVHGLRQLGEPGNPHRFVFWPPSDLGIGQFRPDVIHCEHEQESLAAAQVALTRDLLARRAPLVLHSWQNVLRRRGPAVRLICAYTLRAARQVMCGNRESAEVLLRQGYRGGVTFVSIIGLDARFFYPKPVPELRAKLGLDGYVVGYFGRRVPEKGADLLLRAVALMQNCVQVVIGGSGPETDGLIALARQLGIYDRCLFLDGGAIPYDSLVDYVNLLDVLVVPSRTTPHWKEQLGRVLLDGMGCKVAVVGSDSGAIPEVIGDGGRVFPEDDPAALARILDELAASPEMRRTLAERGYRRVLENYSVEALAGKVLDMWRELAAYGRP